MGRSTDFWQTFLGRNRALELLIGLQEKPKENRKMGGPLPETNPSVNITPCQN